MNLGGIPLFQVVNDKRGWHVTLKPGNFVVKYLILNQI